MPYYPAGSQGKQDGHHYHVVSYWVHLVAEYAGLNLYEVWGMDYLLYLTLRRDAFIARLSSTDAGQEYLDSAWRMEQTKPDREALRKKFGRREDG